MIRVIPGDTGEGKTQQLIETANNTLKEAKGNLVYIDGDNSHIYALRHEIRYINISEFPIDNYHEFFGFMCGILSEDNDISHIFVDGLLKMANLCEISNSDELINKLKAITDKFHVKLIASINCDEASLPEFLREFALA
jgi:predicted ATP-dependent serine protease